MVGYFLLLVYTMSMKPTVSIIVLTYNSVKHLPALFESLAKQLYTPLEIIVVDNASSDATIQWLEQQAIITIDHCIKNSTNDWYAKGNNAGIKIATGDYILFCNDDVVLEPDYVTKIIETFQKNDQLGIVGGKLLKNDKQTIDTTGLVMKRSRQVVNRGENLRDTGQYNKPEYIFGISGALLMIKRSALEAIRYQDEYIDEDFIAYKDDVDLSWRMWRAGYSVYYEPSAVAYHARTIQHTSLAGRGKKSAIIRAYSYRNHWWTLIKNEQCSSFIKDSWMIIPYEFLKFCYILCTEWATVAIIPNIIKGIPLMKRKRIILKSKSDPIRRFII